jgi:isopentenyldiphosphate isomerase
MEKWDILNAQGTPTGKTVVRGRTFLRPGEFHLVVHIWIVSPKGELLIQKRSMAKKLMPGEWAATGGSALSGESSFCAAKRELFEELGISANEEDLKFIKRIRRRNSLVDVWFISCDTPADKLKLQKSEVASARWVNAETFCEMVEKGKFHNYGKDYFNLILETARKITE